MEFQSRFELTWLADNPEPKEDLQVLANLGNIPDSGSAQEIFDKLLEMQRLHGDLGEIFLMKNPDDYYTDEIFGSWETIPNKDYSKEIHEDWRRRRDAAFAKHRSELEDVEKQINRCKTMKNYLKNLYPTKGNAIATADQRNVWAKELNTLADRVPNRYFIDFLDKNYQGGKTDHKYSWFAFLGEFRYPLNKD